MLQTYPSSFLNSTKLLQFHLTATEYNRLVQEDKLTENIQKLPNYLIARCPLCNSLYKGYIDTYSLHRWGRIDNANYESVLNTSYESKGCEHFVAIQKFLNLNGNIPTEIRYLENGNSDVPVITPELLLEEGKGCAVVHCLPICRIENDSFVPRYSLYLVTYFSEEPEFTRMRAIDLQYPTISDDELVLSPFRLRSNRDTLAHDLQYWIEQGKLYWLDLADPLLALRSRSASDFPYSDIQGFNQIFVYRKRPKPRWFWQQKDWHPDGDIRDWSEKVILARSE